MVRPPPRSTRTDTPFPYTALFRSDPIIAAGFAPNGFVLDINEALDVPRDFPLSAPWNLPSRLFQFPIEVIRAEQDEPRKIGLRHPLLAAHPFVQHVEHAQIGRAPV